MPQQSKNTAEEFSHGKFQVGCHHDGLPWQCLDFNAIMALTISHQ
jgi:hypothetical protein